MMKYKNIVGKTIINGDTTIVYGKGEPSIEFAKKVLKGLEKVFFDEPGYSVVNEIPTKGIAHRSPNDVYDVGIGEFVASKKAELKARQKYFNTMYRVRNTLIDVVNLVEDEMIEESRRIDIVTQLLEEIKSEK